MEWSPGYHIKGWGKFNRHYGDFAPTLRNGPKYPLSEIKSRNIPCVFQTRDREGLGIVSPRLGIEKNLRSGARNGAITGEIMARI
jgi:hypothetical protein